MSSTPRRLSALLLCLVLALLIYRAKTQSLTHDEAFAFELYIDQDLERMANDYDACNHVLQTFATWVIRSFLGTSELVLRIPSLIGGLLFLIMARRLSILAAGGGWLHLIGFSAMALNPYVLDFLVAARGYGLATALLLWSLYFAVRWLTEGGTNLLYRSGIIAGLAIACNLTIVVPMAALGLVLLLVTATNRTREWNPWRVVDSYGGPAVVTAFVLVVIPLARAAGEDFYLGTRTMKEAVATLWTFSAFYAPERSVFEAWNNASEGGADTFGVLLLYSLFVAVSLGAVVAFRRFIKTRNFSPPEWLFLVSASVVATSIAFLVFLNRAFGVLYPYGRTGLYLLVVLSLAAFSGSVLTLSSAERWRPIGRIGLTILCGITLALAIQIDSRYMNDWRFDSNTDVLVRRMAEDHGPDGTVETHQIAASDILRWTVRYYRKRQHLHWVNREIVTENLESAPVRYFILKPEHRYLVDKLKLRVLAEDPFSQTCLARRT